MNDKEPDAEPVNEAAEAGQIVVASQVYPPRLLLVPIPSRPAFPKMVTPLVLDTPELAATFEQLTASKSALVGLVLKRPNAELSESAPSNEVLGTAEPGQRDSEPVKVLEADLYRVGVVAQVLKMQRQEQGPSAVLLGALDRFEIRRMLQREPQFVAQVNYLYEPKLAPNDELRAYALAVVNSIKDLIQLNPLFKEELNLLINQGSFEDPGRLADYAAFLTSAPGAKLQEILETLDVRARLEKVLELLRHELEITRLQAKLRREMEERLNEQQREFFLRQQLKAIKKELGLEKDDKDSEIQRFLERLKTRVPSEEALTRIDEEMEKLKLLEPSSPEFNVTRNYLDWLTILPWGVQSEARVSLASARASLDEHHYGLSDVKSRILEFIAAGLLRRGNFGGSIVCLVGPPGVGKTSIGRSIAKALGREFYRFSLGGMRDEAEIKGHRRTYIGAMPGKFVQALRVCKTQDPLIMLDEIDKVGASFRGDPASALLEALDPEQNRDFLDHYLDVRFDLSNVLFVCTANQLDTIPPPLLDRMEVIKLSGYILEEKLAIAERFLVPRELKELGLESRVTLTRAALRAIIEGYAREAGLRNLEQQVKKLARKSALRVLEENPETIRIGPEEVEELLGKRVFSDDQLYKRPIPGVVLGLAWTSLGGDTLYIEATKVESKRSGFKQTGQLGKVMIESSEIAYTLARSLCSQKKSCQNFFDEHFVHLHVPAGATPKDGPSAGVTMAAALYTLARQKPVKPGFAMTGELDLSGHVLPVGGIKEKLIAAKRAKVKHVVLPKANQPDFERLPEAVKKGLTAHFVSSFDDVIRLCLN